MKTRRMKRGGAKMRPLKKKNTVKHRPVNLFKKPTFGQANAISEQVLMNIDVLPQKKSVKKGTRPDRYLERVVKLLDRITEYEDDMTPEQEQRQEIIASIIAAEIKPTLRNLNVNIQGEDGETFEFLDEVRDHIEDLLEDYDEETRADRRFQLKTEMVLLASTLEDAIKEGKRYAEELMKNMNNAANNAGMNNLIAQASRLTIKRNNVDDLTALLNRMAAFK
jgi:hypothetical protein